MQTAFCELLLFLFSMTFLRSLKRKCRRKKAPPRSSAVKLKGSFSSMLSLRRVYARRVKRLSRVRRQKCDYRAHQITFNAFQSAQASGSSEVQSSMRTSATFPMRISHRESIEYQCIENFFPLWMTCTVERGELQRSSRNCFSITALYLDFTVPWLKFNAVKYSGMQTPSSPLTTT